MKIKMKSKSYEEVVALPLPSHKKPKRPWFLLRTLVRILSIPDLMKARFSYRWVDKKKTPKGPYLILMNHSSFLDLKIASKIFYPMAYNIVATSDSLMGKEWLMRRIGCIPTEKFVSDMTLIRDMKYALLKKKRSVLMYPEAGYTFDGRSVTLPDSIGGLCKMLKVPVLMVTTYGGFHEQPLYNALRHRKVKVSAEVKCLFTPEELEAKSADELNAAVKEAFSFDGFAWQKENKIAIRENTRADGLEKLLYRCPDCEAEGHMISDADTLICKACGHRFYMNEYGEIESLDADTRFSHIPDWCDWERDCVKNEVEAGTYAISSKVKICMTVDYKSVYDVGQGSLLHNETGFVLSDASGKVLYEQKPLFSHSVCADLYWYERGDVIGIGPKGMTHYCIFEEPWQVYKARLGAEELYKKLRKRH